VDIVRPEVKRKKRIRLIIYIVAAVVLIPLVTYALSRLKPAAPSVDNGTIWTDTVKRGPMLREVRGLGTLVPETILLIPANVPHKAVALEDTVDIDFFAPRREDWIRKDDAYLRRGDHKE